MDPIGEHQLFKELDLTAGVDRQEAASYTMSSSIGQGISHWQRLALESLADSEGNFSYGASKNESLAKSESNFSYGASKNEKMKLCVVLESLADSEGISSYGAGHTGCATHFVAFKVKRNVKRARNHNLDSRHIF